MPRRGGAARGLAAGVGALVARRCRDRLPAAAPLPRAAASPTRLEGRTDPRHGPQHRLPLGARRRRRPHRPRRHHGRLPRLRVLRHRPHQPVSYLGEKGPHGAFNAIPSCAAFRAAVNAADLDYLVTSPFLNFIHPGDPIASPEARWLRGETAVQPILRNGPVTVWRVRGPLDPGGCGPATRRCAKSRAAPATASRVAAAKCWVISAQWHIRSRTRCSSGRREGGRCRRSGTRASGGWPTASSMRSGRAPAPDRVDLQGEELAELYGKGTDWCHQVAIDVAPAIEERPAVARRRGLLALPAGGHRLRRRPKARGQLLVRVVGVGVAAIAVARALRHGG